MHKAQTELVKAQTHAAQCEDEAKVHQDVIKGLQVCFELIFIFWCTNVNMKAMVDESYRLLSALQHDHSVANTRISELQDYALSMKDAKADLERALTTSEIERTQFAKENENLSELYKIASDSLRGGTPLLIGFIAYIPAANTNLEKSLTENANRVKQLESDLIAAQAESADLKIQLSKYTSGIRILLFIL